MGDYFKPLQRKIGLVTLTVACVFMAAWVRSYHFCEQINLSDGSDGSMNRIASYNGKLFRGNAKQLPNFRNSFEEKSLWVIPYWPIVIPLTLLSAGLLLRKFEPSSDVERAP